MERRKKKVGEGGREGGGVAKREQFCLGRVLGYGVQNCTSARVSCMVYCLSKMFYYIHTKGLNLIS